MSFNFRHKASAMKSLRPWARAGILHAHNSRLERDVAVKVLPASFSSNPSRLLSNRKRAPWRRSTTPNILAIYDIGTHDGAPYLVSELLEGETLRDRLGGGALPPRKVVDYAVLPTALPPRTKGIVHRDLNPKTFLSPRTAASRFWTSASPSSPPGKWPGGESTARPRPP